MHLRPDDPVPPATRTLGASGLRIPSLILGSGPFRDCDDDEIRSIVEAYIAGGGFALEITDDVGPDIVKLLGTLLREQSAADPLTLARTRGADYLRGCASDSSRRHLAKSLDSMLDALGREHVDIWVLDGLDGVTRTSDVAGTVEWAVTSGRTNSVAVCGVPAWQAVDLDHELATRGLRLAAHVLPYSLLERDGETSSIRAASSRGYGVLGASPLAGGALTGKYRHGTPAKSRRASLGRSVPEHYFSPNSRAVIESLSTAAEGLGVHASELAIAWGLARQEVSALIVGARTVPQISIALRASNLNVPQAITDVLDEVSGRR